MFKNEKNYFENLECLYNEINKTGYVCSKQLSLAVFLAYKLNKPLLLMSPPGCGKTEIAKVVSNLVNGKDPIRLQCYEGISSSEAIYDWDFKKQLLYIESTKDNWENTKNSIYDEDFLSPRPLLKSITSNFKEVLLIDELDKSDEEFEAFLLEFLAENQITISENKTIKAKYPPLCFITSNNNRDLSDALLRRCLYLYIDYPSIETEIKIVSSRVSNIDDLLITQIVAFVDKIRKEDIDKVPSISETIDWAKTLISLNKSKLDKDLVKNTLNILLKTKNDIDKISMKIDTYIKDLPKEAVKMESVTKSEVTITKDSDWDF